MAGIYIHIPFCKKACHYCDFHFSISLKHIAPMLDAIKRELEQRKKGLEGEIFSTLYFGGGTPSLLNTDQLKTVLDCVMGSYNLQKDAEITLEVNPDDLEADYLAGLKPLGFNRLSIGVQAFHDEELKLLNRTHTGNQGIISVENAVRAGFDNVNLDLIYGIPGYSQKQWQDNLNTAVQLQPAHISAYHLTYERGSVLEHRRKKSKVIPLKENESFVQFDMLVDTLEQHEYCHYEISNFAREGKFSRHNRAYWSGEKYYGFGPSAHSFNGLERRWNYSRNASYIASLQNGNIYYETEIPDRKEQYHEYLLTHLRTNRGISIEAVDQKWGSTYRQHLQKSAEAFINGKMLLKKEDKLVLTRKGMFISDYIISSLFMQP